MPTIGGSTAASAIGRTCAAIETAAAKRGAACALCVAEFARILALAHGGDVTSHEVRYRLMTNPRLAQRWTPILKLKIWV